MNEVFKDKEIMKLIYFRSEVSKWEYVLVNICLNLKVNVFFSIFFYYSWVIFFVTPIFKIRLN